MTRLGTRQLELLRAAATMRAVIVPDKRTRRLCELGLMTAVYEDGSFSHATPDGLRALADAADAGRIKLFEMPKRDGRPEK